MDVSDKSFVQYYLQELSSLEDECAEFAESYPQIAGNLGMGSEGTADPHVRQLIESVAFIAARLKRQIDVVPGELAHNLLHTIAPHLIAPVPSMSVARFFPLSDQLDAVASVPTGALRLRAKSEAGDCLFTGCMADMALWPLEVVEAGRAAVLSGFTPRSALPDDCEEFVLKIAHRRKRMAQNAPGELTFFISGAMNRALAAVEALTLGLVDVSMVALDGSWRVPVGRDRIETLGFDASHRLLPSKHAVAHGGSLALEFLNFPRRFCFVKVSGLNCPAPSSGFYLSFIVKRSRLAMLEAVREHIHLNCVPVINAFVRPPIALRLKDLQAEYALSRADAGQGKWDVLGINRVQLVERGERHEVPEFHSGVGDFSQQAGGVFWQGIRRERISSNMAHASMALRFVGLNSLDSQGRSVDTAMVEALCTNCEAPESLQASQPLEVIGWDCGYRAKLEFVPTPYAGALLPTSAATGDLLRLLQSRFGRADNLMADVRRHLALHDRTHSAYAASAVSSLRSIRREVVAMPMAGAPLGAMLGMGCRYSLAFRKGDELSGSRYLFSRLIREVLLQLHDGSLPLEVQVEGANGEVFHVR